MSLPLVVIVEPASPVPPFEQIRAQVAEAVAAGRLAPGAELPSVRQLARDLGVAPNTVARAYGELERDGWVRAVPRRGVLVAPGPPAWSEAERHARLRQSAAELLATARRLGFTPDDALRALADLARESATPERPPAP